MFLGDFNAHHASWCRARQNRAGINISDQLDDIDEYVMMNMESTEYVATTTYDTTIDLSIVQSRTRRVSGDPNHKFSSRL